MARKTFMNQNPHFKFSHFLFSLGILDVCTTDPLINLACQSSALTRNIIFTFSRVDRVDFLRTREICPNTGTSGTRGDVQPRHIDNFCLWFLNSIYIHYQTYLEEYLSNLTTHGCCRDDSFQGASDLTQNRRFRQISAESIILDQLQKFKIFPG